MLLSVNTENSENWREGACNRWSLGGHEAGHPLKLLKCEEIRSSYIRAALKRTTPAPVRGKRFTGSRTIVFEPLNSCPNAGGGDDHTTLGAVSSRGFERSVYHEQVVSDDAPKGLGLPHIVLEGMCIQLSIEI